MEGNGGNDVFKYESLADSSTAMQDFISGFTKGADKIDLTGLGFTGISSGAFGTTLGYAIENGETYIFNAAGTFEIGFDAAIAFANGDFIF
jgi:hypothetical protein